jgi:hypothetical protein
MFHKLFRAYRWFISGPKLVQTVMRDICRIFERGFIPGYKNEGIKII